MRKIRGMRAVVLLGVLMALSLSACAGVQEGDAPIVTAGEADVVDQNHVLISEETTDIYQEILSRSDKEFLGGLAINESFLMWFQKQYGTDLLVEMEDRLTDKTATSAFWKEKTGKTIAVLWTEYCKAYGYSSYLTENITEITCKSQEQITLDFIGDINLDDKWYTMKQAAKEKNGWKDCISADLVQELSSVDLAVANNEFTFSTRGKAIEGKEYTFRSNPENVSILQGLGIDLAILANNHTYDFGPNALSDTKDTLQNAGILTSGAGMNSKEAQAIQYVVANGYKLAFVSATEVEKFSNYTKEADEKSAGVLKMVDPTVFLSVIQEAEKNSDYVIAYVHWGIEGESTYNAEQHALAEQIVDEGADVIIGTHTHRLSGVEYIKGKPVVYGLGNFWFSTGTLFTSVARVTIDANGTLSLRMLPCLQQNLKTSLLKDENWTRRFYRYLADMSSGVAMDKDGYIYDLNTDEKTKEQILDTLRGSKDEWYMANQAYTKHSSGHDSEGHRIDVIGNVIK